MLSKLSQQERDEMDRHGAELVAAGLHELPEWIALQEAGGEQAPKEVKAAAFVAYVRFAVQHARRKQQDRAAP
jgi:acyl-CoA reductase-like NAD-dependent aldehyde dehydrogenase